MSKQIVNFKIEFFYPVLKLDLLIPVITDKNKSFYYHASLEVEGIVYVGFDPSGFVWLWQDYDPNLHT